MQSKEYKRCQKTRRWPTIRNVSPECTRYGNGKNIGEELTCEDEQIQALISHPLPSGRDYIVERMEWKAFVDELRTTWKTLWLERIDDKVKAEGIARKDYSSLFVDRGIVIVATRDFKPLDFVEILERHKPSEVPNAIPPSPSVGGWGKFIRSKLSKQKRFARRKREAPLKKKHPKNQQKKKGGRGWLHY